MKKCNTCHWYRIDGATPCEVLDGSGCFGCEHWQPMTHGDVIRESDDVQLAGKIAALYDYLPGIRDEYLPDCATDPDMDIDKSMCMSVDCCHCVNTILNWIRSEVTPDGKDE